MRWVEEHWGTQIVLEVPQPVPEAAFDDLRRWFARVDDLFSTWRADSEVRRLAAGSLALDDTSIEVREVLDTCEELKAATLGAFDIEVGAHPDAGPAPGRAPIDPSGYVKGWALEGAAAMLRDRGAENFWMNAGGDVVARGRRDGDHPWQVGIQHPWIADRAAAVIELADGGVATSGRYERGDHVLDPRTGRPATTWMSMTVAGPDLGLADAYATAAMALGADGIDWLTTLPGIDAMGITAAGQVVATSRFRTEP